MAHRRRKKSGRRGRRSLARAAGSPAPNLLFLAAFLALCAALLPAGRARAAVIALYEFKGANGNFNTAAFDSTDADADTTASRLSQSGGLTGGGAGTYILSNAVFDAGNSGRPGLNAANVSQSSPTHFIQFLLTPEAGAARVKYESLSFFTDTWSSGAYASVRVLDGAGAEQVLAASITIPGGNVPVELRTVDFPDFTSSNTTTWRIYFWGTSGSNYGVRFDDITLIGAAVPEPCSLVLLTCATTAWLARPRRLHHRPIRSSSGRT